MPQGAMKFGVGQPVRRKEDDRFLRGAGRYTDDFVFERQTHAVFLRSPHGHAEIRGIDAAAALVAPGVLAVLTEADLTAEGVAPLKSLAPIKQADGSDVAPVLLPQLARGKVRFVGQPVACVVAETAAQAQDASELIDVDYEELPTVADARQALATGAPTLHDEAPGNLSYFWEVGDRAATDAAFAAAAHVVRTQATNPRIVVSAMEPRAVIARYDEETARWIVHCATQGVHAMRARLAEQLRVDPERIRLITPDVGGGFGMKLMVHPEYVTVALAARRIGRPVKWTAGRSESFLSDAQGRDLWTEAEGAFDADGKLLAMRHRSVSNIGAYYSQVGAAVHTAFSAPLIGGMYRCPAAHAEVRGAFTNTTPTDAYRGAGRPEVNFVNERLMDAAAVALKLDPAELRRRNLLTEAEMPYAAAGGSVFDSGDPAATFELGLSKADYGGVAARKAEAKARGKARGVGVAYFMERTGGGPVENARIRIRADGRIEAWIGTQSTGQGHETAWSQLIHEKLGAPIERIEFPFGDSDLLTAGGGTGGSRSLIMAHRVFFLAAEDVIEKGRQAAADKLEAAVADIEFSAEEGGLFRIAGTDRTVDLFEAAEAATDPHGEAAILGEGGVNGRESTFPNGAHIAEAEVDPETGEVALLRYTILDDFGTVLNPLLIEGQVHGGVAQGVGQSLFERAAWDPDTGQPLTGSYMDYQLPRAADFPMFAMSLTEAHPTPSNALGVKGCGEAGCVGGIPAAALAVLDALRGLGVADLQAPFTPDRVWRAINDAGR